MTVFRKMSKNHRILIVFKCFLTVFSASQQKIAHRSRKNLGTPFLRSAGGSQKKFWVIFHFMRYIEAWRSYCEKCLAFLGLYTVYVRYKFMTIHQRYYSSKKFRESLLPKNSNCPEVIMRPKVFMAQKFVKNAVVKNQVLGQSPHHQHCLNHPGVY